MHTQKQAQQIITPQDMIDLRDKESLSDVKEPSTPIAGGDSSQKTQVDSEKVEAKEESCRGPSRTRSESTDLGSCSNKEFDQSVAGCDLMPNKRCKFVDSFNPEVSFGLL